MTAELRKKKNTIREGERGEGIEENHPQSVIITMYRPSKPNGAPLNSTPAQINLLKINNFKN